MGGGIALNTMVTKPGLVDAYVLYAAVSGDLRDNFERWIISRPAEAQKIIDLYQTPESNPAFWNNLSPHQFFDNATEPVHVFHGTADASVPLAWSERTVSLLKAAGKQVEFTVYDGQPHEFSTSWSNFMQTSAAFFDQAIKNQ
jgi:dipeptidyl aminopeptidase/acylaminoacyl peptidase